MKRSLLLLVLLSSISLSSAAQSCVDLSQNLSRGSESSSVLALQNFLSQKGYLKATPNGYFGPGTTLAVKTYQKSVGIVQTGAVFNLTRQAIKKETCSVSANPSPVACTQEAKLCPNGSYVSRTGPNCSFAVCPSVVATSSAPIPQSSQAQSVATSTINPVSTQRTPILPVPSITSIDKATFIYGGKMTASLVIRGTGFSTSSNVVYFKLQGTNKIYTIATSTKSNATSTIITLGSGFTTSLFPCGDNCTENLPVGGYDVVVKNAGGESNSGYISIKSFTVSSQTGTLGRAIPQPSTQAQLGTITFGSSVPVSLESIYLSLASSDIGTKYDVNKITNIVLKDELANKNISGSGTYDLAHAPFYENQSKIYGVYADVKGMVSGMVSASGTLKVKDYIGNNLIEISIPAFLVSISG